MEPEEQNRLTRIEASVDALKNRVVGLEIQGKKMEATIPEDMITGKSEIKKKYEDKDTIPVAKQRE